ncbi:hypothetical protein NDU88_000010 [Pleurodeles waltl]|uniref:Uncharacterized protein n=1 Tax=Pleurodeles waltl TaxID=8319 RepID=A0AAV7WH88_PLEWA|nr:hypothetical protein NDU88_000010 [Pleurodeles waltl]
MTLACFQMPHQTKVNKLKVEADGGLAMSQSSLAEDPQENPALPDDATSGSNIREERAEEEQQGRVRGAQSNGLGSNVLYLAIEMLRYVPTLSIR